MRSRWWWPMVPVGLGAAVWASGGACASDAAGASYLTLRAPGETYQMRITPDGKVLGASFQLHPTGDGYYGSAHSGLVSLHSDGARITGSVAGGVVDLHVKSEGPVLRTVGTFGGRMGRLTAAPDAIASWLGPCRYDLQPAGQKFEGTRICARRSFPGERVSIELPPAFADLAPDRRAMLLALLLSATPVGR